jgi:hypothetical protein
LRFIAEFDILPAQPAQFGRAQSGHDRRHQERAPSALGLRQQLANFIGCRNIDADPEFRLVTLLGGFAPASSGSLQLANRIVRGLAVFLGDGNQGPQ